MAVLSGAVVGIGPEPFSARAGQVEIAQAAMIERIIVNGAQRVEPGTVKSYLLVREGDNFDPLRVDRSLKSLFATGLFADVAINSQGSTLIVNVVENPVINRIAFEGNRALGDETLEAEVSLRPRVIYTRTKVQDDLKRMLTLYRREGRFAVSIEPKVIQLPQNRIDLAFEIDEGEPTTIRSVRFVGNRRFSDRKLRSVIRTKETAWYRFLASNDIYDPDRLTLDRELLRQHYLSDGYADFRVTSAIAELTPDQRDFFVTFGVSEGERYKIGKISVDAKLRDLEAKDIAEVLKVEPGEWYDVRDIDKSVDDITARVGELGYAFVDVRPRVKRDRETRELNITFQIKEGPRVFVERIDISGNVRTLDKVIRREFQLVEGDAFNTAKLRRSRNRLSRLDFFEKVTVDKVPGSAPDKAVVKVEVEEKSTGSISLGAGYSSSLGPIGEISLVERNFLGRGQNVGVSFSLAAARSEIDFTYTEPYFLNRDVAAGFDIFHIRQDLQALSSIDTKRTGLRLRTGYRVTPDLYQRWAYLIKRASVEDVDTGAAQLVKDQEGKAFTSQITHKLSYDTLDSKLDPTEGYSASILTDLAGLGGSVRHVRNTIRAGLHHPINEDLIFSVGSKAGYIVGLGKDVEFLERYFVGNTEVRGFESSGFGPRDSATDDALGAEWMYSTKLQMTFPLGLPADLGIKGRIFSDLGSSGQLSPSNSDVQDDASLRMSAGVGMTWRSPMGPVGMDAGFPILKESYDKEEIFQINFGARF